MITTELRIILVQRNFNLLDLYKYILYIYRLSLVKYILVRIDVDKLLQYTRIKNVYSTFRT